MFLVLAILLLPGCASPGTDHSEKGQATLIFIDTPEQRTTDKLGKGVSNVYEPIVAYVDSSGFLAGYNPRGTGADTLDIPAYFGYAEILHLYQVCEKIPCLIEDGDTVLVTYDDRQRPEFRSLRYGNTWLYNLPSSVPGGIHENGYSLGTVINDSHFKAADNWFKDPEARQEYPELADAFKSYHADLDSAEISYKSWASKFSAVLDSLSGSSGKGKKYAEWYRTALLLGGYDIDSIKRSDSLLHYATHLDKLMDYPVSGGLEPMDFTGRFDYIAADTTLRPAARKALLRHYIERINRTGWTPYPYEVENEYNSRYLELTGDSSFVRSSQGLPVDNMAASYEYDLVLQDRNGNTHTLSQIIDRHRGKVIYADFWASWCAPCRGEMPKSLELMKNPEMKGIIFMYISLDNGDSDWKQGIKDNNLGHIEEHYRIVPGEKGFIKETRLTFIPRYMIFGKDGNIANPDAPRPSSPQAKAELLRFIQQTAYVQR